MKTKAFGHVREIPGDAEKTRTIPFILSTADRDRHHSRLNMDNWVLEPYRRNPIVGFNHNLYGDIMTPPDPDDVIAKSPKIGLEIINGKKALVGYPVFETADLNLKADKVFRKLLLGTLNASSVGFLEVGTGQWGVNEEAAGHDNETYYFQGQELLEFSVVTIPSNPQALVKSMRSQASSAISYAFHSLGGKWSISQIENMRVKDVLDLFDAKDLEIRTRNLDRIQKMLSEPQSKAALMEIINEQMARFRSNGKENRKSYPEMVQTFKQKGLSKTALDSYIAAEMERFKLMANDI